MPLLKSFLSLKVSTMMNFLGKIMVPPLPLPFFFGLFLRLHPWHMEIHRLGIELEL